MQPVSQNYIHPCLSKTGFELNGYGHEDNFVVPLHTLSCCYHHIMLSPVPELPEFEFGHQRRSSHYCTLFWLQLCGPWAVGALFAPAPDVGVGGALPASPSHSKAWPLFYND